MCKRVLCGVVALVVASTAGARAATPEQVAETIRKGREWLLSKQKENGTWEVSAQREKQDGAALDGVQWGGLTSLATYALLASGESVQNPKVQAAVDFLKTADIIGVYALGMRSQVWQFLPPDREMSERARMDRQLLLDGVLQTPDNIGLYDYATPSKPDNTRVDHSVSQYGVLGAWALDQLGAGIPTRYWELVEERWEAHQDPSGGWAYEQRPKDGHPINMSMTAAGVATLFITQDYLHANEGVQPRGNITSQPIEAGLKWMKDNFDSTGDNWYAWYGIERIGVASGLKYFGSHNWYEKGADLMVQRQHGDGHWSGGLGGDIANTSFCLLFLSRGRAPIMASKLEYEVTDPKTKREVIGQWNQRPREIANVTRWVGRRVERELNWQIVNLKAPAEELAESPIIYLAGSNQLNLSEQDKAKLKAFIEDGGMVIGNPDGGRGLFAESFKELGQSMFPGYTFRDLPEKHVIFTGQQFQRSKQRIKLPMQGLSNGARELMIALPAADLARSWQLNDTKREEPFQVMANLYLYATDKTPQYKGERVVLRPDASSAASKTITVARLQYSGNWNPEPGGWRRMQAVLRNRHQVDLKVTPVTLGEGKLEGSYNVAHLTGTDELKLTAEQQAELKKYVEGGGMLIVDAAGGSSAFRGAMETELTAMFAAGKSKAFSDSLKPDSTLYTALGEAATTTEYRNHARLELGRLPKAPLLRGVEVNGKYRVLYSPQDLSVGLMGQPVDGIFGYSPKSATDIMAGLLLYAVQ